MKLLRYTFDNINVRKIIIISVKIINKLLKFTDKINFNFNLKLVRKIISFVQKINIILFLKVPFRGTEKCCNMLIPHN